MDRAARKIMLSYMERGWMYTQLKERIASDQSWMGVCKELGVCSRTANRYIGFYELTSMYPCIIVCNINFETIMYCKDEIGKALYDDYVCLCAMLKYILAWCLTGEHSLTATGTTRKRTFSLNRKTIGVLGGTFCIEFSLH